MTLFLFLEFEFRGWDFQILMKYSVNCRTNRLDVPLKIAFLFALPALFAIWLGLSIAGSVLVGVGYGFFTPWVSAFEAFRHDNNKFRHCVVVRFQIVVILLLVKFPTILKFFIFS